MTKTEGLTTTQEVRAIAKMASVSERTVWRLNCRLRGGVPDADFTTIRVRKADVAAMRQLAAEGMSMADVVSALIAAYRQPGQLPTDRFKAQRTIR